MSLQQLEKLRLESQTTATSLAQQEQLIAETASLISALISEIQELRDYNESMSNQLYGCQNELSAKDSLIERLQLQARHLQREVVSGTARAIVMEVVDRAFFASIDRELESSLKMRSGGASSFLDSIPRHSKMTIENFKKSLMNSTKKKQQGGPTNCRQLAPSGEYGLREPPEDEKSTLAEKVAFYGKLTGDSGVISKKNASIDFDGMESGKRDLRFGSKGKMDNFESEFEKRPYEIFSEKKQESMKNPPRRSSGTGGFDPNEIFAGSNQSCKMGTGSTGRQLAESLQSQGKEPTLSQSTKPLATVLASSPHAFSMHHDSKLPKDAPLRHPVESDKAAKPEAPDVTLARLNDLSAMNKEMTLKDMKFASDPKVPHLKVRFFLRIKEEVPIQLFDEFNRLKTHFSGVFMNKFNSQGHVLSQARRDFESPDHVCFVTFGAPKSGKTYTTQGFKDFPGLLPSYVSQLDFKKPVMVQMFEVRGEQTEDLIRLNSPNFDETLGQPTKQGRLMVMSVGSVSSLNKVFKVVISRRMKRERIDDTNFVVRLIISPEKSVTFVECCSVTDVNLPNLAFIRLIAQRHSAKLLGSKNQMVRLLLPGGELDSRVSFNFIGHLCSISNTAESAQLVALFEGGSEAK